MTDENIKQTIEGFTQFMRGVFNNPNLVVPNDLADKYNISSEYRGIKDKANMKRIIITLEADTDETDEFIKQDLENEINCCSIYYEVKDIEIN